MEQTTSGTCPLCQAGERFAQKRTILHELVAKLSPISNFPIKTSLIYLFDVSHFDIFDNLY